MRKLFNALMLVLIAFTCASCHKELDVKDPVVSNDEMTVSGAQARFSWCVEFSGAFQTGVELSPNENMTELRRVEAKKEGDKYVAVVDGLLMGTKYYYRIVVWNKLNNYVQEMKSFSTSTAFTVTLACNPQEGGTAMGDGTYVVGDSCTVVATANVGYNFVNWTENGSQISAEAEYSFAVTVNRNLVANFTSQEYTITATAEPEEGGSVNGSGGYNNGDECTLTATANEGYTFINWTKDGMVVSIDSVYTFTVTETAIYEAHFQLQSYTITVSADQEEGGFVEGGGTYEYGQNCTVRATEANGYHFVNWTENGEQVSSEEEYTFTVIGNRDLVANFTSQQYTITVSASPTHGGSVTGGGTYYEGEQCTVTATANTGYAFTEWCEIIGDSTGGIEVSVSSDADYTFTVNSDLTLVAKFIALPQAPEGAINGKFTINANGDKVYFSKGNLQYIGSSQTWKFADNQWEVIGTSQGNTSQTTTRDLFGWGTSGWDGSGATYYHPWDTDNSNGGLYGPPGQYYLTGTYANADWGVYNPISNGGGQAGQWRTLTKDEWVWVLGPNSNPNPGTNCRTSSTVNGTANARFAKAKVNNLQGVILFPDSYTHPSGVAQPVGINETGNTGWNGNNYSTTDFGLMQDNGAVFLPAAGLRYGTSVNNVGSYGHYWSASCSDGGSAYYVYFNDSNLLPQNNYFLRYYGQSVRLVCPAEN